MRKNLHEKKLDQVKESVRICKLNIKNQEKKLGESNKKLAIIKSKIASLSSNPSTELDRLINMDSKLMVNANLQKGLILEFQGELNLSENKLQELQSSSIF